MASYGLEAVNQPLEEAASQLSLDSLRDHKNSPYLNFSRVRCICQEVFALHICNIMTIRKFYCSSTLICPIQKTYGSPGMDQSFGMRKTDKP